MSLPTFRFAPSPNGNLHLGHAYSALLNHKLAKAAGGRMLLRIEDIDTTRCTAQFEAGILRDLEWLGVDWERPVRRQSEHLDEYHVMLERLLREGLVYPAFMSRNEIRAFIADSQSRGCPWPHDPEGVPLYPAADKNLPERERRRRIAEGAPFAWRLDMAAAIAKAGAELAWPECEDESLCSMRMMPARPQAWGDVIVARREIATSYHLSVVIDDALQGVTHAVRGMDLFHATGVQRLLQHLLGLPSPAYFHHRLVLDPDGRKLSKSRADMGLCALRAAGAIPAEIRRMVGIQFG